MSSQLAATEARLGFTRERAILIGLAIVGLLATVAVHPGQLYIDTRPDLYLDPGSLLRESLSTWVPGTGLGTTNYDNGYLPAAFVLWVLNGVGLPAWLAMRLWRYGLLLVAAWGARALLVDLMRSERRPLGAAARIAAPVLYVASPYVVVGAATTPVMLPYAVFPWLLLALRGSFGLRWLRSAAWFGLLLFGMGGMNAGVVPAFLLLAVPFVAWDAVSRERRPWRRVVRGVAASAVTALLVSAYWMVSTVVSLSTASAVAAATEDPRTVAQVSSFAEVMRGLGSWLIYGGDSLGLYREEFSSYLDSPLVVMASFALPVVAFVGAWLSPSRLRRLAVLLTVVGLTLMVGAYPPRHPTPFGAALLAGFDHVPGFIAFRTTSKAGALAMLGMAILGALGADAIWARLPRARGWLAGSAAFAVLLSVTPVWVGMIFPGELTVPSYWKVAAHDLDSRGEGRLWALPGETNALYRWRPRGVDDFAPVLLDRPVVYGRSFPDGPIGAWNMLSSADEALVASSADRHLLSTYARYLGVNDVLVRNDMIWELMGAARPLQVVAAADGDRGLQPVTIYGNPGENVTPSNPKRVLPAEQRLSPLVRYRVEDPLEPVRVAPATGQLLVAGDNGALAGASWSGLLDGSRTYRLLADASDDDVLAALDAGGRVLLTDTNRRHADNVHRLDVSGPLLAADGDAATVHALGESDDQTVAVYDGIAGVTATASGSIFGPTPSGRPFLAIDGNPETSWQFGDFGSGVGRSITIRLLAPTSIQRVVVDRTTTEGAEVASLRLDAGGVSVSGDFEGADELTLELPEAVSTDSVTLTVTGVTSRLANQVGLSEITVPGMEAEEYVRLPMTLERLASSDTVGPAVAAAPIDVLLGPSEREGEVQLHRQFDLPSLQDYRVTAEVLTPDPGAWKRCRTLAVMDGEPVKARVRGTVPRRDTGLVPVELRGCGRPSLAAGTHRLLTRPGTQVRHLLLTSLSQAPEDVPPAAPVTWTSTPTSVDARVPASGDDSFLFLARAYDARWRATIDGQDAGAPVELNGYGMAWPLPAGSEHRVVVTFGPQHRYTVGLWLSLLAVAALVLVVVVEPLLRRRREARSPDQAREAT
ncbi:MAG: DUF3367 domain-containing protein [Nocardioidaceae bacterium]|nr:DUF3367 domain-containing protein [Nocardioidaceae bacterium]